MLKRTLTAIGMGIVLVPLMLWGQGTVVFPIIISLTAIIAEFELLRCFELHKNIWVSAPLYIAAAAAPFAARYLERQMCLGGALAVLGIILLIVLTVFTFSRGRVSLQQACAAGTVGCYVILALMSVVLLSDSGSAGNYICLLIFIGAWSTDVFAYLTGRMFGKHKLIPSISPKKTVEGSIGGMIFCVVAFIVYAVCLDSFAHMKPDYVVFAIGGLFVSVVAQAGDLIMSAIKRSCGIKDFGKILPGHGGIIDRFDSVMAVALMLLLLENFFGLMRSEPMSMLSSSALESAICHLWSL